MLDFDKASEIPVMEHFYTIQGEGKNTGRAAYFIRLAGCDVECSWCDVKDSWSASKTQLLTIDFLIKEVSRYANDLVVITGGEPSIYDLTALTAALKKAGKEIAIETSGSSELRGQFDWICLSPKKFKLPLASAYKKADELKVVIFNKHDFKWCKEQASNVLEHCELYLQPEWDKQDEHTNELVEFIKDNPTWRLSLQTHKFLDIP
jgi:organic radical activating enzyme